MSKISFETDDLEFDMPRGTRTHATSILEQEEEETKEDGAI